MIPDPIERINARIEAMAHDMFAGVEPGKARCPFCKSIVNDSELIATSGSPDASACCFDCLSPEDQLAYEEFHNTPRDKRGTE